MKTIHASKTWKRSCALITLFTFLFELVLPAFLPGLSSTAFAAEGDDGSAGSANYYQQELEKFGKGKYHAGESGVMTYSYPLGGGVSANYNSEGGWSVGGHSRIARSTKWGVPEYSDDDIFTLNGQELVKSNEYNTLPFCDEGAAQTVVYHTESENYQRILYCKPGQSDSYWKIFNQDGSWSTYGTTADSRIEAIGKPTEQPRAWAIAESRDKGNYHVTTYAYTEDSVNGSYYLDKIVSGKTGAAADGYKATLIAYETRPDQRTSYRSGAKVKSTKRVKSVVQVIGCDDTGSGGSFVNGYNISWTLSPQTQQSIITSITPYGSDLTRDANGAITGGSTLPATTFDYQAYEGGFNSTKEDWTGDTTSYPLRYTTTEDEDALDCNDISDGLVACYPFNGNANDESGNGNHAIDVHGPTLTEDQWGNPASAYDFDGVNDYIELPFPGYLENGSISAWVNISPTNTKPYSKVFILSLPLGQNSDDVSLGNGTSDMSFGIYYGGWYLANSGINPEKGKWYHFAGTWGTEGLKVYVNGELKGTNSAYTGGVPERPTHS